MSMYMTDRFTADEDERLINEVAGLPMLWHVRDADFKNTDKKEQAWNMIAQMIRKRGAQCKIRWRSIRDHYKRQRKQERLGLSGAPTHKKRAIYWEMLNFLDHEEEQDREVITSTADLHDMLYEPLEVEEQEQESIDTEEYEPEDISIASSFCTTSIADSPEDAKQEVEALARAPLARKSQKIALKKIKGMRRKYKKRKGKKDTVEPEDEEDDIGLFFRTMAATVRKFDPNARTEAKMKIFSLVTSMELASQIP